MRGKREMDALTKMAEQVKFPQFNTGFHAFTEQLRALVADNFGYDEGVSLAWDQLTSLYYWELEEFSCRVGDSCLMLGTTVELNPYLPIDEEMKRIAAVRIDFKEKVRAVRRAVCQHAGGDF